MLHIFISCNDVGRFPSLLADGMEDDFRTRELMPFGPVAESESRFEITFSTFSGAKDKVQEQMKRARGWEHKIWKRTKN